MDFQRITRDGRSHDQNFRARDRPRRVRLRRRFRVPLRSRGSITKDLVRRVGVLS